MRYRARPVFVSGTFRDFHAERDAIASHVFPVLVERLAPYRTHLERVDLRVGVETKNLEDDHAKQALVLKVCLADVRRCRPFLVILMGDRYGWVPPVERARAAVTEEGWQTSFDGKSVTALEIEFGLWGDPEQRTRSRVYFRRLDYAGMADHDRVVFDDAFAAGSSLVGSDQRRAEAKDRAVRLAALKERITSDPVMKDHWREYTAAWDGKRVTGLEGLVQMVVADLLPEMQAEADAEMAAVSAGRVVTPLEEFVADRARGFTGDGRKKLVAELVAFATGADAVVASGLVLAGPAGSGKSALFARTVEELAGRDDVWVLAHSAGIDPRSTSVDALLEDFVAQLAAKLDVSDPLAEARAAHARAVEERTAAGAEGPKPEELFADLLARASARRRVIVVLDALDRFEHTSRAVHLTWLPAVLPANVRLVATAIPGVETEALGRRTDFRIQPLAPLGEDEAREVADGIYERYHHAPNRDAVDVLIRKKRFDGDAAHDNPLWLVGAVEELNLFDADDFAHAEQDFAGSDEDKLYAFLQRAAQDLSPEIPGLYQQIFRRAGRAYGTELLRASVATIAAGRAGFRERDLATLVPAVAAILDPAAPALEWDALAFAALRRGLRAHLVRRGADDQWDFHHAQAREAGLRGYLGDASVWRRVHSAIATHLLAQAPDDPLLETETMHHLICADEREEAARFYTRELTRSGFEGCEKTLADHARTKEGLAWVVSLLHLDGLSDELRETLAFKYVTHVCWLLGLGSHLESMLSIGIEARGLLRSLLHDDPNHSNRSVRAHWILSMEVSLSVIGAAELKRGELNSALAAFQERCELARLIVRRYPEEWAALEGLCKSLLSIGSVRLAMGSYPAWERTYQGQGADNLAHALTAYREAVDVSRRAVAQEPGSGDRLKVLATGLGGLSQIESLQGKSRAALSANDERLRIYRQLAGTQLGSDGLEGLAEALVTATVLRRARTRVRNVLNPRWSAEAAASGFAEALGVQRQLVNLHPERPDVLDNLARVLRYLGEAERDRGRPDAALIAFHEALEIARRLGGNDPDRSEWLRQRALTLNCIGRLQSQRGDAESARRALEEADAIYARLTKEGRLLAGWQSDLAWKKDGALAKSWASSARFMGLLAAFSVTVSFTRLIEHPFMHGRGSYPYTTSRWGWRILGVLFSLVAAVTFSVARRLRKGAVR